MKILESKFVKGFIKMADDGYQQGWHERNGGNLSYRLKEAEVEGIRPRLNFNGEWLPIGTSVPGLAGEFFLVTGTGKYFKNITLKINSFTNCVDISFNLISIVNSIPEFAETVLDLTTCFFTELFINLIASFSLLSLKLSK